MSVAFEISSEKLAEPMKFSMHICSQILSRTFVRQPSMFSALWQNVRIVHSTTGIFTLQMRPAPIKRVGDLWRMSSQHDYVKGEEILTSWAPRGVSLVVDYINSKKKRRRVAEIAAIQNFLRKIGFPEAGDEAKPDDDDGIPPPPLKSDRDSIAELLEDTPQASPALSRESSQPAEELGAEEELTERLPAPIEPESEYNEHQTELLGRCLQFWVRYPDPLRRILSPANTDPPVNGVSAETLIDPEFISTVVRVPRNPKVLKGGYLLVPNSDSTRWVKRFVELRRPYLHIHNVPDGDEVAIVSLRNSRVDSQPGILGLLDGGAYDHQHVHEPNGHESHQDAQEGGSTGSEFRASHRRTSSGRLISTIWTGSGGGSNGTSAGLSSLSERMQQAVFAIYGTDNTWLFTARSERDKLDWIFRIDQSYASSSAAGSGTASPFPGGFPRDNNDDSIDVHRR